MILSIIVFLIAIAGIIMWVFSFTYLFKYRIYAWFDNKFGKDDPMPPMPSPTNQERAPSKDITQNNE